MAINALNRFTQLIANDLRAAGIRHIRALERRHYLAQCWCSLQERLGGLDDSDRQLVQECVISCIETAIDSYLQALQKAGASMRFADAEVDLADVEELVETVFRSFEDNDHVG